MKKNRIIIIALLAAGTAPIRAQEDLSKQLEVTRAYTPNVGPAVKLPVTPDMTDTVRLRPEISYRINSTASATSFETRPYEAATLGAAPFAGSRPLYLRAGVGAPLATEFDLYYAPHIGTGRSFGLFANHAGSYSKIKNDLGVDANATEVSLGGGLWGARKWKRYSLEGDLTYDSRLYNPYGVANDHDMTSGAPLSKNFVYDKRMDRFTLRLARAGVSFGDNFTDLSRFNFRIGVGGGYADGFRNSAANGYRQTNLDFGFTAAKMFGGGRHGFELVLAEKGTLGRGTGYGEKDGDAIAAGLMPRYLFSAGNVSLRAGFDVHYIMNKGNNQNRGVYAPYFEGRVDMAGGAFVPFLSYTSHLGYGDRETLSRCNPYTVTDGTTAWINDARIGFSGDLGDVFSYKVAGGLSLFHDYQLFVGTQLISFRDVDGATEIDYPPMWFTPLPVDGTRFTAGVEFALHNLGGFGARFYGNWNGFEFSETADSGFEPVGDLPKYDAGLELSYRYGDVFSLRIGAELIGERDYLVRSSSPSLGTVYTRVNYMKDTIAPVVDLTMEADVKIMRDFWVYLEGENLANRELYPYPHYRGVGASILGGVKIVF